MILTVVLAGDRRLQERLRETDLLALDSRLRVRLPLDARLARGPRPVPAACVEKAGNPRLLTPGLLDTLIEHAGGNHRTLMAHAHELLLAGAEREAAQFDEAALLRSSSPRRPPNAPGRAQDARDDPACPSLRACDLPVCAPGAPLAHRGLWADRPSASSAANPSAARASSPSTCAVAVAAGVPCLRRFPPLRRGPVLLYAAEDALHLVRTRLEGLCLTGGVALADLPLHVITAPTLRLDLPEDRTQLQATVAQLRPILLVLDPFVRLHRIDENASSEVAPLLAYLRELQRRVGVAVVLVHHARKARQHVRAGQALRGSSEFHAWGDSNLYLRRTEDRLLLTIEHRAAPSQTDLPLQLHSLGDAITLAIRDSVPAPARPTPLDRVRAVLAATDHPVTLTDLRQACRIRTAHVCRALATLTADGHVRRTPARLRIRPLHPSRHTLARLPVHPHGNGNR